MLFETDLVPFQATRLAGRRALVLAPHPDDETFGCGGALAIHRRAGDSVRVVFVTDGAAGDSSGATDRRRYVALRRSEAEAAGAELGLTDLVFWDYHDRETWRHPELGDRFSDLIAAFQPEVIYTPSAHEIHPDHRAVTHWLLQAAAVLSGPCDLAFYEVSQAGLVNCLVDITAVLAQKLRAMNCYSSQLRERPYKRVTLGLNRFRTLTLPANATHAEGFLMLPCDLFRRRSFEQVYGELLARRRVAFEPPQRVSGMAPSTCTASPQSGWLALATRLIQQLRGMRARLAAPKGSNR